MADPVVKRIVCLANSRKLSGRCLAGKDPQSAKWIRPVSDRPHEEVSEHERNYEDGSDPRVLDIIDVPLKAPSPRSYQSENWLLDPDYYWIRRGRASWSVLAALADDPSSLWSQGDSTRQGCNDRVELATAETLTNSLWLIPLDAMVLRVFAPGESFGNRKRRVHGEFRYNGISYHLWVTDPGVEREYLMKADGRYPLGPCFVTVSLGEPFEGHCYKLLAAIVTPEQAERRSP